VTGPFKPGWLQRVVRATTADLERLEPEEPRFELAKLRALFRTCFSHAPIGLAVVEQSQEITVANDALCAITGQTAEQLVGGSMEDLIAPDDRAGERELRARLLAGDVPRYITDLRLRRLDGTWVWVRMTVAGDGEAPASLIYQVEDITERRRYQEHLEHLIDQDPLTGLFNRRRFDQELEREVARSARTLESGGAVLTLDLDGFKAINDTFGHAAGDELLRGIADALRARSRATDVLARLGGDEFGVLLVGATPQAAEQVASAAADIVAGYELRVGDRSARVSASIGVALFGSLAASELAGLADEAMYRAKASGRGRVVVAGQGDD
jgi:diguanylate cyclase (GGDEF)-like protein/PAS domain S-box-containing protein